MGQGLSPSTDSAGLALPHGHGTEQLSRSELARQIRANFDNLVRASPLPRVRYLWWCRACQLHSAMPPCHQAASKQSLKATRCYCAYSGNNACSGNTDTHIRDLR